ncbi:MAG TPA: hypothetical protein VMW91_09185 [Desulfosporosinus sp.]|nr:hypothetical protein [Desulfosporosinus sp.]
MSDKNDLVGWCDVLREQSEKNRKREQQRKQTLAPHLETIKKLPFEKKILEAYKTYDCGLMSGREFVDLVFESCRCKLGLLPED